MIATAGELLARLRPLFEENFSRYGELGAAVSVWHDGRSVVELHGGFRDARREKPWTKDSVVLFWSATKGLGSACLLHVLEKHGIGLQRRPAEFWPEFSQNGKAEITLAQLLSHQAGLAALDAPADILDYAAVVRALEKQKPLWPPGSAHGYHARTFGFLLDELVRRIDGRTLSEYWRQIFAEPLSLDLWIGLPAEQNARVASIYPPKIASTTSSEEFYRALATPGTLSRQAFSSPRGLHAVSAMNAPENRARAIVSLNGIGNASSLAKFYALLSSGGEYDGRRFFLPETIRRMTTTLSSGMDLVFLRPTAFSAGFMKDRVDTPRPIFGPSPRAFGHPGAGGSHAFADPDNHIAFAYVMNQMEQKVLPNDKSLRLIDALYGQDRIEGRG